jgi:YD repeat-containing protein
VAQIWRRHGPVARHARQGPDRLAPLRPDGRLRYRIDGTGAVSELKYDANGNVTETIGYVTTVNPLTWDGSIAPTADAAPRPARRAPPTTSLNRATVVADALGSVVGYTYDLNGNLTRETRYARPTSARRRSSRRQRQRPHHRLHLRRREPRDLARGPVRRGDQSEYDGNGNV